MPSSIGEGLREIILDERALASEHLGEADLPCPPRRDGRRSRSPPAALLHRAGFQRPPSRWLGSTIARRELGRYARSAACLPISAQASMAPSRSGMTVSLSTSPAFSPTSRPVPTSLAPGHPLHDALMSEVVRQFGGALNSGTVLVSSTLEETHLLVGVIEEVTDASGESVARRFSYAYVDSFGTVTPAGPRLPISTVLRRLRAPSLRPPASNT